MTQVHDTPASPARAAKKKFSYTTAEGNVETRTSARAYTHVVVGRYNVADHRAHIEAEYGTVSKQTRRNFEYLSARAAMQPGQNWTSTYANGESYTVTMTERDIKCARDGLFGATTVEEYNAILRTRALTVLHDRYGDGDVGREVVLQWSQSRANAQKAVSGWQKHYAHVRVVAL